jgi:hypothetical protein
MRRLGALLAAAGLIAGLSASPVLADHDDHHHDRWRHHDRWEHHDGGYHHRYYDRGYYGGSYYYDEPRVEYYAAPRVYVPPPPSFGLNLVFPIH